MKKYILAALLALAPNVAYAQDGQFPGSAWFNITGPHIGGEEKGNWILSGNATQSAILKDIDGWKLNTYVSVNFSKDTKGYEWNNKITPAVGIGVAKYVGNGVLNVGVQAVNETHYGKLYKNGDRSATGMQVGISYWVGWGR